MAGIGRSSAREHELVAVLLNNNVSVAAITETEIPPGEAFSIPGYTTFAHPVGPHKTRVLVMVRADLAMVAEATLVMSSQLDVWVRLTIRGRPLIFGGIYRQWSVISSEREDLDSIINHCGSAVAAARHVLVMGDFNLDPSRSKDTRYTKLSLLMQLMTGMESVGLTLAGPTAPTFRSHGTFNGSRRTSLLDLVYTAGLDACVDVLPDAATDHYPVIARAQLNLPYTNHPRVIQRRNYKGISGRKLCQELDGKDWSPIYGMDDVDTVHDFVVEKIQEVLNVVAPVESILVKQGRPVLYLQPDTLRAIAARNQAVTEGSRMQYRVNRNLAAKLIRRDKLRSNMETLIESGGDPKKLWELANMALGKSRASLPPSLVVDGKYISGNMEMATTINNFYVQKIQKLRDSIKQAGVGQDQSGGSEGPVLGVSKTPTLLAARPHPLSSATQMLLRSRRWSMD